MENLNEVRDWERTLKEELIGLRHFSKKLKEDTDIPEHISCKLLKIASKLKSSATSLIGKCSNLQSERLSSRALKIRLNRLKEEYNETLKNISDLLESAQIPKIHIPDSDTPQYTLESELENLRNSFEQIKTSVPDDTSCFSELQELQTKNQYLLQQVTLMREEQKEWRQVLATLQVPSPSRETSKRERFLLKKPSS